MSKIVVGIAGGTGSGKTTVAKKILQAFDKNAVILSHDYYYKEYPDLPRWGRSKERAFEQKEKVHKHFPLSR